MSKYDSLAKFLSDLNDESITMSFGQVSRLLPGGLPESAFEHRPWWANRSDGQGSQNMGWQSVGWETAEVDMAAQKVTFYRVTKNRSDFAAANSAKRLTIDEAKEGLAAMFNVSVNSIEITIRG